MMKKSLIVAGALLSLSALFVPQVQAGSIGQWAVNGWTQWHPHTDVNPLAHIGTQSYFDKGGIGDSDGDGVTDDKDQCPNTPKGDKVDAVGCTIVADADGDGVLDNKDQCPNTPKGAKVDTRGCWVLSDLNFEFDSATILREDYVILDEVATVLNKNPGVKVRIEGHTDLKGSEKYNQKLSERRAASVVNYLEKHGVADNRLSSAGFGFDKPIADNASEEGRAKNRRVELTPVK